MSDDQEWWDSNISRELEDSLALGGVTRRELDPPIGEFLQKVSQIESILAATAMAYFEPVRPDRARELEALLSFHLSFDVLIDLLPRLLAPLSDAQREWIERQLTNKLAKELHELREFRNALAHGTLWWDFEALNPETPPPLKVRSYSRTMKLKSEEVTHDVIREWQRRAHEACAVVGQIHYWMTESAAET